MLLVGDKEVESSQVSVRNRKEGDIGSMSLDSFIKMSSEQVKSFAKE